MLDIYDELRRLVELLEAEKIDYALCGGLAMAVHGQPRATIDIDLLIHSESSERLLAAAAITLDYRIRGMDMSFAKGVVEIRRVSKIDPESGDLLSLDLLLVTPPLLPVWESRIEASWEGGQLIVVSPGGLIALKQLRGSGQDLDDIKKLKEGTDDAEG
jgi:hypothetical protein